MSLSYLSGDLDTRRAKINRMAKSVVRTMPPSQRKALRLMSPIAQKKAIMKAIKRRANMTTYLSGDVDEDFAEMSGKKGKAKRAERKAKKGEGGKKKGKFFKKIAKVGLAPARAAILVVIRTNFLKLAKKLAKVWENPAGKAKLLKAWDKFGGSESKLKATIAKGSKQTISADEMGSATLASAVATATPIIIAFATIIKSVKGAGGSKDEATAFDEGLEKAKETLANDPPEGVEHSSADVPEGQDIGVVKGGSKDDEKSGEGGGGGTVPGSLGLNPGTISLLLPLLIASMNLTAPFAVVIGSIVSAYSLIGIFVLPFAVGGIAGEKIKTISMKYFSVPADYVFYKPINFIKRLSNG